MEFSAEDHPEIVVDNTHITMRDGHVTCNLTPDKLQCLREHRVNFTNIMEHGFDLWEEVLFQGWETYFNKLNVPVYVNLVKEFWKQADFDTYHVVLHVLGKRIIITEKTIAQLLGPNHREGIRINGRENKSKFISTVVNKMIFTDFDPAKSPSDYKPKTLKPKIRIWHRILLGCINPRALTFSSDYINANQKCLLYHLQNKDKLCLPAILFLYLRESIQKSRTTANESKKIITYIPIGRLITDILVENDLVRYLREEAQYPEDLTASVGDVLMAKNLKNMGIIEEVISEPVLEKDEVVLTISQLIDNFPPFTKQDNPEAIAHYIFMMKEEGNDMSWFNYDMLLD